MRHLQTDVAWEAAAELVAALAPLFKPDAERTEAFRLIYTEVLAAVRRYEALRARELGRLNPRGGVG